MNVPKPKPKKHKMTVACDVPKYVKFKVFNRDNESCVICGNRGLPNAHFISRAKGGLGREENIVTLCPNCHHDYDNGDKREEYGKRIEEYLRSKYPDWDKEKLVYDKYGLDPAWKFDNAVK